ncbi:MAG: hypothetical protein ACI9IA_001334 [Enterobacterales bacterium]|jgi:hypothetical protein
MNTAELLTTNLPDLIKPSWWTGSPAVAASTYVIDCSNYAMNEEDFKPGSELDNRMNETFDRVGLVHLINTGMSDAQSMRKAAMLVVKKQSDYKGGSNPRNALQPNIYEVGAPLPAWLHYHHEMAYVGSSTKMLAFLGRDILADRGWTFVSDNVKATDDILATDFGQKLKEKGLCYHRDMTNREYFKGREQIGVYNHWQKSMLTEDPEEAIEIAKSRGLDVSWGPNRLLKTRFYTSAFEYFEPLDRNLLFSSVADHGMWFDTWPLVMHLPYDERPLNLTFGDDTPMSREELQLFVDIYDNYGTPIKWQQGDVAIICNYRFAHGRPEIILNDNEHRELGVIVGDSFDRVGDVDGKW